LVEATGKKTMTHKVRRKRMTIERLAADCLDVRDLRRRGIFGGGWMTIGPTLRWPRIVEMRVARYAMLLNLRGVSAPQRVRISWAKIHFGGERPWFHCPHCQRRGARLYGGLSGYFCRACVGNPIYASQALSAESRGHFQACKLRLRLGGEASLSAPFPERPRRMQRRTYDRLRREGMALEAQLSERVRSKPPDYSNLVAYLP
jgi:hypothetical protein